jgi:hypothetical protein
VISVLPRAGAEVRRRAGMLKLQPIDTATLNKDRESHDQLTFRHQQRPSIHQINFMCPSIDFYSKESGRILPIRGRLLFGEPEKP